MRMRTLCGGMGFLVWECAPWWLVKERLVIGLRWPHVTVSVSLMPLFRCFSSKTLLLTDPKSMQSCLSHILRFSFKSLLLINLKIQSNLRLALFSHFSTAFVSKPNTASG